jgi:hypothetical protein
MSNMECKLGVTFAKRFPSGMVTLKVSDADKAWVAENKFTISGWDYPMLIIKGASGTGEGIVESTSMARAILANYGFAVPDDVRVPRMNPMDTYDVTHENLVIPESMVPEFPIDTNYHLTLAAYRQGLQEATQRGVTITSTMVTCIEEGTRKSSMFLVDTEDQFFFSGTKYKLTQHGQALFFCEDGKYRTATQELIRRGRLGVTFGAPDALFRRTTDNKFDLRKSAVAVFRTVRKAGR